MERACFRNNRFNLDYCRLRNIIGLIPFVLLLASMVIFSGNTYKDSSDTVILVEPYHNTNIPESSYDDMIFRLSTFNPEMYKLALSKLQENYPLEFETDDKTLVVLMEFTAMPGEILSCIGCHEDKNRAPLAGVRLASRKKPQEIQ